MIYLYTLYDNVILYTIIYVLLSFVYIHDTKHVTTYHTHVIRVSKRIVVSIIFVVFLLGMGWNQQPVIYVYIGVIFDGAGTYQNLQ